MAGEISKIGIEADQGVLWLFALGPTGRKNALLFALYASFVLDENPRIFHMEYPYPSRRALDVLCFCASCGRFQEAPHSCPSQEVIS